MAGFYEKEKLGEGKQSPGLERFRVWGRGEKS